MNRRLSAAGAVSLCALLPSAAHAAFSYGVISYTDIADTFAASPYSQVVGFPSINNSGQIGFSMLTRTFIQHVYISPTAPGALIDVADTAHGFSQFLTTSLNNNGVVAFGGVDNSNQRGLYTSSGSGLTTVADNNTSSHYYTGTPRLTDAGAAAFIGFTSSPIQVLVKQGNTFTTVAQYDGGQFEGLTDAAINNSNQVAFNTDDYSTGNNNGAFVYRYTNGALLKIGRAASQTSVAINDSGVVAYQASTVTGSQFPTVGIFASNGTTSTAISRVNQPLPGTNIVIDGYAANGQGTPINSAGLVALQGSGNGLANYGIYVGDGTNTSTIIHIGQSLFGKTVSDFGLGRDAINDAGQVTFNVNFTDGTAAIVRSSGAVIVPEPANAACILVGGFTLAAFASRSRGRVKIA